MHTTPVVPEGWAIKSDLKNLQYQLHGDILPRGYEIVFSETSDFAEFVDIPDEIQKSAKPGFIFNNPVTGNSLQKGQDGLWRGIKEKAKKFVGKVKNKFGKSQAKPTPEPEEEDLIPPRDPFEAKRPGKKEEIQQDMKPELSPKEQSVVEDLKTHALKEIEHGFFMTKAGLSKDPDKHMMIAKSAAKDTAALIAKKTGQTPSKVMDELMKLGEIQGVEKTARNAMANLAPLYKDMLDIHYLVAQGAMDKQAAADQTKQTLELMTPFTDKLKVIAKELSEIDPSQGDAEELLKKFQSEANKKAKELHNQGKDDLLPKEESSKGLDSGWKTDQDDDLEVGDGDESAAIPGIIGELIGDLENSVSDDSLKGPMKNLLAPLDEMFNLLKDSDDIQKTAKYLKGLPDSFKESKRNHIKNLKNVLKKMRDSNDPGYEQAKYSYKELLKELEKLGLEEYIPGYEPPQISSEGIQSDFDTIKSSVSNISMKNPIKKATEEVEEAFKKLLRGDDIKAAAKAYSQYTPAYKIKAQGALVSLGDKIKNMYNLGDPGYPDAKETYDGFIKKLKDLGLEEYTPGYEPEKEESGPGEEPTEKEKNYGYMLDSDFRYEPSTKLEDLTENYKNQIEKKIQIFESHYIGKLPESFGDASAENLASVNFYTGSSYSKVNNLARGKSTVRYSDDKFYDYLITQMDEALTKMQIQPPEELKRGVGSERLKKALLARKPGDVIYDHGYFSASSQEGTAKGFKEDPTGEVLFIVKNAQGYYVDTISQSKGEAERIFPRGSAFKILSMKQVGRELQVEMEHQLSDSEREKYEKQQGKEKEGEDKLDAFKPVPIPKEIEPMLYAQGTPLGGTTGAKLVEMDGQKFVVKKGVSGQQNKQEKAANSLYRAARLGASNQGLAQMGSDTMMVSQFIPGKDLGKQDLSSPEKIAEWGKKIARGHAMDALINNRDVFGPKFDNIRIGDDGEIYRIDNGGSFDFKGLEGKKPFDGLPIEFFSMIEKGGGKTFYKDVPIQIFYDSIKQGAEMSGQRIKEALNQEVKNGNIPKEIRDVFFMRYSALQEIKDCYDFGLTRGLDPEESHHYVQEFVTGLHRKNPDAAVSYLGFKKYLAKAMS